MPAKPSSLRKTERPSGDSLAAVLFDAALEGARALRALWRVPLPTSHKPDGSPVCEADYAAETAVSEALDRLLPGLPLVSEEHPCSLPDGCDFFLMLDPLDGTRDFIAHGDEFCVCLAAIENGIAVAGAIVAPAMQRGWHGAQTAHMVPLDDTLRPASGPVRLNGKTTNGEGSLKALVSRRHSDTRSEEALRMAGVSSLTVASSAIKFGMLAEGVADLHVRFGPTMAWDIAAGDAILAAAGGAVRGIDGARLRYARADGDYRNPPFVAVSRADLARLALHAAQRAS
jgi:3'(2'), 5'-bisphosphate nucleotidase